MNEGDSKASTLNHPHLVHMVGVSIVLCGSFPHPEM